MGLWRNMRKPRKYLRITIWQRDTFKKKGSGYFLTPGYLYKAHSMSFGIAVKKEGTFVQRKSHSSYRKSTLHFLTNYEANIFKPRNLNYQFEWRKSATKFAFSLWSSKACVQHGGGSAIMHNNVWHGNIHCYKNWLKGQLRLEVWAFFFKPLCYES